MHTAKELHDFMEIDTAGPIVIHRPSSDYTTILRALSLLASVEDEDGIVRELREFASDAREFGSSEQYATMADSAAALIVAQRQELERVKAERDSLRKHAEAMESLLGEWMITEIDPEDEEYEPWMDQFSLRVTAALEAYRAAHPKGNK